MAEGEVLAGCLGLYYGTEDSVINASQIRVGGG